MFEDEVKGKRMLRIAVGLNIICLLLLVFYVCTVIFLQCLNGDFKSLTYPWCALLWAIIFVPAITLISIQLTLDVDIMLFKDELDEAKLKYRIEVWIKVTSIFLLISAMVFSLSLFIPGTANPSLIFILGFGGLFLRLFSLSIGYQYLSYLNIGRTTFQSIRV